MRNMDEKTCTIKDCKEKYLAKGLCRYHYTRKWAGSIRTRRRNNEPIKGCGKEGCERKFYALNMCRYHYDIDWNKKHSLARTEYFITRRINRY